MGSHSTSEVSIETIATQADGSTDPRDLDFHPKTGDLWVVNGIDSTATVLRVLTVVLSGSVQTSGLALGMAAIVVVAMTDADCNGTDVSACDYVLYGPGQALDATDAGRCVMVTPRTRQLRDSPLSSVLPRTVLIPTSWRR